MTPSRGVGLVGCGRFGAFLLESVRDLSGVGVAAVTDTSPAAAVALGERYGACVAPDVAALIADPRVGIVVIATPPVDHAAVARSALAAGRHVFCEKPMARTVDEATAVAAEVRRTGCQLVVDHVLRYNPLMALLESLQAADSDGGRLLGPLRRFALENDASDEHLSGTHWFWDPAVSGGIPVEHGVHFFDACAALMGGDPVRVQAIASGWVRPDVVDTVLASAVYPHGGTATFYHAFTHADRAEHQLTRLDWGFAEARIDGWIPVDLELDVWCGEQGRALLLALPQRAAEVLRVPGYQPSGAERLEVREVAPAAPPWAATRTGARLVPYRLRVTASLGGPPAKVYVYRQSVRAAMADLLSAADGGTPRVGAAEGWRSVATAAAVLEAAATGRIETPAPAPAWLSAAPY